MLQRQLSFADYEDAPLVVISGQRIAITGYLPNKRSEVIEAILDAKGIYVTSVSRATDILVLGQIKYTNKMNKAGSRKLLAAKKIIDAGGKIQILYADDFLAALDTVEKEK